MKPIQHILEAILDNDFDVSETDINPLMLAFKSAKITSSDRCKFDMAQWMELWKFVSPVYYKGVPK